MTYKIPKEAKSAMHFALTSTFGMKEPVFTSEHLALCEKMTLLLLRRGDEGIPILLHSVEVGKFKVSFGVCN